MPSHTADHLKHEALVSGVSNTLFNGIIAALLMRGNPPLTWSGNHSFVGDVIATAILLPFIVALIVIPLQRSQLKKGKLVPAELKPNSKLQKFADLFPSSAFKSAVLFALLGLIVIAPLTLLGFYVLDIQTVSVSNYAVFKGLWAGLMAAILVVPMVLVALRPSANSSPLIES